MKEQKEDKNFNKSIFFVYIRLSYLARGDSPERDKRARLSISQMV
jgi:hypothetical protein